MHELHGAVFTGLKKYVDTRLGRGTWRRMLHEAALGEKVYLSVEIYDAAEAGRLVAAAARLTEKPTDAILEDFGEFFAADFLQTYRAAARPEWKTLGFLENARPTIDYVVRTRAVVIESARIAPEEVAVTFGASSKICTLVTGLIRGVALHYGECVQISCVQCVANGDPACKLTVRSRA